MVRNIIWTEESREDLHDIFEYYSVEASREVAEKITASIIKAADQLIKQPIVVKVSRL